MTDATPILVALFTVGIAWVLLAVARDWWEHRQPFRSHR